jgi:hypothetical protein
MPVQAAGKACHGFGTCIEQSNRARVFGRDRRGDRGANPAGTDHEAFGTGKRKALALGAAGKALAVEHVAIKRAIRAPQDGVAGAGHLDRALASSSSPTVVTLCGIVTSAPWMLLSRNSERKKIS